MELSRKVLFTCVVCRFAMTFSSLNSCQKRDSRYKGDKNGQVVVKLVYDADVLVLGQ